MKTTLSSILFVLGITTSVFSQVCEVPNGSFETWEDLTSEYEYYADLPSETIMLPENYFGIFRLFLSAFTDLFETLTGEELVTAAASLFGISQSTDASDGSFAARIGGDEYYPFADLITIFECTSDLPSSFSIDVKHVGEGADTLTILGQITDNSNLAAEESDLEFAAGYFIIDSLTFNSDTEYTTLNVPIIDNMNGVAPDTVIIIVFAAGNQDFLEAGGESYFLLDNMEFQLETVLSLATNIFVGEHFINHNHINWSVAYESSVSHYIVERTIGELNDWTEIHTLDANSDGTLEYSFKDYDLELIGNYYYRLRRVDVNGNESLSETISINVSTINKITMNTYPNPIKEQFTLDLNLNLDIQSISFTLFAADGRSYVMRQYEGKSFDAGQHQLSFDTENIPSGVYNLRLDSPFAKASQKIVITKEQHPNN